MSTRIHVEPDGEARLDQAIAKARPEISRRRARALIEAGQVFVDGKRCRVASRNVKAGARILIHADAPKAPEVVPILHEDEGLLVIDKPAGLHLNETETTARISAVEALGDRQLFLVHRIDVGTTGVVLLAKTAAMAESLSAAFRARTVEKLYVAIATGLPESMEIDQPIGHDKRRPRARMVRADGKASITGIEILDRRDGLTSVLARPLTGRTHQIRVHLAHVGAPLLGDTLYGGPAAARLAGTILRPERPLLHAHRLRVQIGDRALSFEAPFPEDMVAIGALGLRLDVAG